MSAWVHGAGGAALAAAAWALPRLVARARPRWGAALLVDLAPVVLFAGLLTLATGRPLFAGIATLALGAGLALADWTMRQTLHEPAVFSEMSELPHLFSHPHLYLPFAGPRLVLGGAIAALAMALALLLGEPAIVTPRPLAALLATALGLGIGWLCAREPGLGRLAAVLRRLRPSGEPFADSAALGPFATLLTHGVVARAERAGRRRAVPVPMLGGRRGLPPRGGPLILVQCESFFDARRIAPLVPRDLLPGFDAGCAGAALYGRIAVPGWGANTMRSEFAVLTGIAAPALGYDRFNPYHAFARVPIGSQIWRLRAAGYRTICLHPFDRRFFRRDRIIPGLGFDVFLGSESLGGSQRPPYLGDPALAQLILDVLEREGPHTAIFAITMGNHGPWDDGSRPDDGTPLDPRLAGLGGFADIPHDIPQGGALLRYLDGVCRSDAMLRILLDGLRGRDAVLGFYGDHQPSLARAFAHFGFAETSSDYFVWPGRGVPAQRRDLPAHALGRVVVDLVLGADADAAAPPLLVARRAAG